MTNETTYSVELKANNYEDDTFNGTLDECIEYITKDLELEIGDEARIAKILVDNEGLVLETLEIIESL